MNKLPRLLQPSLIVILLISVFALIFVAYTQHEAQQQWKAKYEDVFYKYQGIVQQDNKQVCLPVTLALSRFGNATDIVKTQFMNNLYQMVEPISIQLHSWGYVTFWFKEDDVINGELLLHLPSWAVNDYRPFGVPNFDVGLGANLPY